MNRLLTVGTIILLIAASLLPFSSAFAALPTARLYIHAGRLIDVEKGEVLRDQVIVVEGERIVAVQPAGSVKEDDGTVVDWSAFTVLPGLIDAHAHLVGQIQTANPLEPLMYTGAQDVLLGVKHARATLRACFTSVRDMGVFRAFTDTIEAARLMQWEGDVGSITAGKYADLAAVKCDPLTDIECLRQVAAVMKGGQMVDMGQ